VDPCLKAQTKNTTYKHNLWQMQKRKDNVLHDDKCKSEEATKQKLLLSMSTIQCLVWIAKALNLANQEWEPSSWSKVIWGWYNEWMDKSNIHLMAKYKAYEQLKKSYSSNFVHNNQYILTKQNNRKTKIIKEEKWIYTLLTLIQFTKSPIR